MKLSELAQRLNAQLDGNGNLEILGVAGLKEADAQEITFLSNPKYTALVETTRASAVIVPLDWDRSAAHALLRVENPDQAFADAAQCFYTPPPPPPQGIHPTAVIAESAKLGEGISIGPHCTIEADAVVGDRTIISANCYVGHKATIGTDCFFHPLVSIRESCEIGNRVILHNGAVIGSDGFGYAVQSDGSRVKIPQIGRVVIEDDVEVGANTAVDRARFGKTRIGKGTKIDNLVQIGHNVLIGSHSVLCGQSGIAGSTFVGSQVILAGQAGLAGHLTVHDGAIIGAQAGVMKDIPSKEFVMGSPAMNHLQAKRAVANMLILPKLKDRVKRLEKAIEKLESSIEK